MPQHTSTQPCAELARSLSRLAAKLRSHQPANALMAEASRALLEAAGRLQKATQPTRGRWVLDVDWHEPEPHTDAALRSLAAAKRMARRVHSRLAGSVEPHLADLIHIERVIRGIDEFRRRNTTPASDIQPA